MSSKTVLCIALFLASGTGLLNAVFADGYEPCLAAPPLPIAQSGVVKVSSEKELQQAVAALREGITILLAPGIYELSSPVGITANNVTVRGAEDDCDSVQLVGPGMDIQSTDKIEHGFWIGAQNTTIANLTISDVFYHAITIDGTAKAPRIYNVRMIDSGQQFIKSNPNEFSDGADNGRVEYSIMQYTNGPSMLERNGSGTGYTNGIDIHAGKGWKIRNNRFINFHTPDNADHLWNAAVLVWNKASDTVTENNTFVDVNRAIAYGLGHKKIDHKGGVIRNNMVVMRPGLYSEERKRQADAPIIVWASPGTKVIHNTLITSGNTPYSIELRFDSSGSEISHNLSDAPIAHRDKKYFLQTNNYTGANPNWFINPSVGDLSLRPDNPKVLNKVRRHRFAEFDFDGEKRPFGRKVDIGADELSLDYAASK